MLTKDEATERVTRGAAHLDRVRPGWFHEIDTGTLTLHDPCGCIIGQLCNGRFDVETIFDCEVRPRQMFSMSEAHGFAQAEPRSLSRREEIAFWKPLQDAWIAAIADRVLAAAQAHSAPPSTNAVDLVAEGTR